MGRMGGIWVAGQPQIQKFSQEIKPLMAGPFGSFCFLMLSHAPQLGFCSIPTSTPPFGAKKYYSVAIPLKIPLAKCTSDGHKWQWLCCLSRVFSIKGAAKTLARSACF